MDILNRSANNFSRLLDVEYIITIGRKGKLLEIKLNFDKADFHHLAGLHKLKDIEKLRSGMRERIFDNILNGGISQEDIEKSAFYGEIKDRLHALEQMEEFLDRPNLYFRYDPNKNNFSIIAAEFVIQGEVDNSKGFLFVDKRTDDGSHFCRSFFSRDDTRYTQSLPKFTLLRKEKRNVKTGENTVQYGRLFEKTT